MNLCSVDLVAHGEPLAVFGKYTQFINVSPTNPYLILPRNIDELSGSFRAPPARVKVRKSISDNITTPKKFKM